MLAVETSHTQKPFPFLRLPRELQLGILRLTYLVDSRHGDFNQSIVWMMADHRYLIYNFNVDGEYLCPYRCDICMPHNGTINPSLLYVSKQLHHDSLEVFLGHNRIVLSNGHDRNLEYLISLHPSLRCRIRHLHLLFDEDKDFDQDEDDRYCCVISNLRGWDRLITWIAENLNLSILNLTIDLGGTFKDITDYEDDDSEWFTYIESAMFMRAYMRIASPLQKLHGLYRCFVFLACHFAMEAAMERAAMGDPAYSSLEYGKVPPISRHSQAPHARAPEEMDYHEAVAQGWEMKDRTEALDRTRIQTILERTTMCLHKSWWVDMDHELGVPAIWEAGLPDASTLTFGSVDTGDCERCMRAS